MKLQDFASKIGYILGTILALCAACIILAIALSITIKFITWLF